ncbi:MAG: UDP-N-acetylmuramate--L-alanine ligase [Anaerolineae bacterium]
MSSFMADGLPARIHMIGIGGSGLSAIARVLAAWGHQVSGSDLAATALTRDLNGAGVETYVGHRAEQVRDAELVVMSSAIPEGNPEVVAAQAAGIPVIKRHGLLAQMTAKSYTIAVAGTHGKTTTASMIAETLVALGLEPTFIVGGVSQSLGTNARAGSGPYFVLEADEYDRTFQDLRPQLAVVTNIEMDHPDCFRDIDDVRDAFGVLLDRVPEGGRIVACADSPQLQRLIAERGWGSDRVITYGLAPQADWVVRDVRPNAEGGVDFRLYRDDLVEELSLGVPGTHNALNATAARVVCSVIGASGAMVRRALTGYAGAQRRFEIKGERNGVLVIDDYAHHPTKVRATLAAARGRYPGRRLWAALQPHTYSRVEALFAEFTTCFEDADQVIITDIYAARAKERPTVTAEELAAAVRHPSVRYIGHLDRVAEYLLGVLEPDDVLLVLGAGDSYRLADKVLELLAGRSDK